MEDEKNINQKELTTENVIQTLSMPLKKLFLYLLTTLGLYEVFWFYYKWKYLRDIEGKKFKPLLLTLTMGLPFLNVILPYILFKELLYISTNLNKLSVHIFALILSFVMALFEVFLYERGIYKLFALLSLIPIFIVQFIVNRKETKNE